MKLPDVDYIRPKTLKEALETLAANGDVAKLIAGGQSLMPMLAFRLLAPTLLIDIGRLPELKTIDITDDGIRLGALTTWHAIERHPTLKTEHPLLTAAIGHVAHYQIRNRGTVGGSLAHSDPAAEFPAIVRTCGAQIVVANPQGERVIEADDFCLGPMTTALEPDDIVIQIRFPRWPKTRRWGFKEFSRRRGDFAVAAAAVFYDMNDAGHVRDTHVGIIGDVDGTRRLAEVEALLNGRTLDRALIHQARHLAERTANPSEDIHAPAPYRRALIGVMVERALAASARIQLSAAAA